MARYEQFLLFPQSFQKACFPGASKGVIVWEWVNMIPNILVLKKSLTRRSSKTVWVKEKINQYVLLFPRSFPALLDVMQTVYSESHTVDDINL